MRGLSTYLIQRLAVLVETAVALLETLVDRIKGRFDRVLKFRHGD